MSCSRYSANEVSALALGSRHVVGGILPRRRIFLVRPALTNSEARNRLDEAKLYAALFAVRPSHSPADWMSVRS